MDKRMKQRNLFLSKINEREDHRETEIRKESITKVNTGTGVWLVVV
jgi:hypothetical protein